MNTPAPNRLFGFLFSIVLLQVFFGSCEQKPDQIPFVPIDSLQYDIFEDLQPMKTLIGDRKLVQLGENGHGMAEYFQLKTRLVKFLHQEMGYNVLAVEGGLGDCLAAYLAIDQLSDSSLMEHCFYDTWYFEEALPLFTYIKEQQNTDHPLHLMGFDNIPTSTFFLQYFQPLLSKIDPEKGTLLQRSEEQLFSVIQGDVSQEYGKMKEEVTEGYELLLAWAKENGGELEGLSGQEASSQVFIRVLEDRLATLDFPVGEHSRRHLEENRDRLMAENLLWTWEFYGKDAKVISWAHNAHVSKEYSQTVFQSGGSSIKRQGEYVHKTLGEEAYSIGMYCFEGSAYAFFMQDDIEIKPINAWPSLENVMESYEFPMSFLDLHNIKENDSLFMWALDSVISLEWGMNQQKIIPKRQYDGLLFVRNVSPARHLYPFELKEGSLQRKEAVEYTGIYASANGEERAITLGPGSLYSKRGGGKSLKLIPFEDDKFVFYNSGTQLHFIRNQEAKISHALTIIKEDSVRWDRTQKELPGPRKVLKMSSKELERYEGTFLFENQMVIKVQKLGDRLFAEAGKGNSFEILPESKTKFYLISEEADLEFVFQDDQVGELILVQPGGQRLKGKKQD